MRVHLGEEGLKGTNFLDVVLDPGLAPGAWNDARLQHTVHKEGQMVSPLSADREGVSIQSSLWSRCEAVVHPSDRQTGLDLVVGEAGLVEELHSGHDIDGLLGLAPKGLLDAKLRPSSPSRSVPTP